MSAEPHDPSPARPLRDPPPGPGGPPPGPGGPPDDAGAHYAARAGEIRSALASSEATSSRLSRLRLVSFLATAALAIVGVSRGLPPLGWGVVGLTAAVFVGLVVRHAILAGDRTRLEQRLRLVEAGLTRVGGGAVPGAEDGRRFASTRHPYTNDLDVFGPASIFLRLNVAQTGPGEARLATWLGGPAGPAEIRERQQAARYLATRRALREDLGLLGVLAEARGREEEPLLAWAEAPSLYADAPNLGAFARTAAPRWLLTAAQVTAPLTVLLLALGQALGDSLGRAQHAWLGGVVLHLGILLWLRPSVTPFIAQATSREAPFGRYRAMLARLEEETFAEGGEVASLARLRASIEGAANELSKLERIAAFADLRHNTLIHLVVDLLLLYDVWCALALERWRARSGPRARAWVEAIGTFEALSSLATYADEHPSFAWPEIDEDHVDLDAVDLGHPLVPADKRVGNDVHLSGATRALLVTGSNMSGKSTLLRSMGINTVLALAGSVVCARSMRVAPLSVRTSMRISDDLERGVSHFYAELARLKEIVDEVDRGRPVLFLLDEILHGTNSRERHIGARAVILDLIDKGAIGAASSHDLALSDLAERSGGRLENVHFEERVEDGKMTFDYRLRKGVVQTANALRLMRLVGLDVPLE